MLQNPVLCNTDKQFNPTLETPSPNPRDMALQADEELFKSAISGYRDAFLVRHSHLPESERNRLWSQQLSQFIPVDDKDTVLGKSGKRTRQDATPRTLLGSGPPQAKRRATVCVTLVSCSSIFTSTIPTSSLRPAYSIPPSAQD